MPEQKRNRIRSFHAPEKPRVLKNSLAVSVAPTSTAGRRSSSSFSRKRFSNSNNRFGHAENQKPQLETTETISLPKVGENIRIIPLGGV